jgi:hypothetical protein
MRVLELDMGALLDDDHPAEALEGTDEFRASDARQ